MEPSAMPRFPQSALESVTKSTITNELVDIIFRGIFVVTSGKLKIVHDFNFSSSI